MTTKVFTIADLPEHLIGLWLQHLRDFDSQHPGCHFQIMADTPDMTIEQVVEKLKIDPKLTFTKIFERRGDE